MAYGVRIECWGDYACFTRPEMKVERVSYDVMTPSAARGLVEAIFWHPGLRYVIDKIDVMSPIQMTNVRRNEVKSKINVSSIAGNARHGKAMYLCPKEDIQQRAALILKNVRYCIHVHFEMTEKANASDNAGKFREMLCRRARKGQCYHQPYLGCREFPAGFRLVEDEETVIPYPVTQDLGFMLYDMDFSDLQHITPRFFHARLEKGVMDLRNCKDGEWPKSPTAFCSIKRAILGKTKYSPVEDTQGDSEPEWQRTGGFASDGGQFIQSRAAEYKVS